jgi:plastocyanin
MVFRSPGRSFAFSRKSLVFAGAAAFGFLFAPHVVATASASDEMEIEISIKDHKFEPAAIKLPTGKRVKISVKNLDPTPEEFESSDIGFEKVIAGNSEATIRVKPLQPGTYIYFGEFHMDTALGHIVVE